MTFIHLDDIEQRELVPGFKVRFVHSQGMTLAYWEIEEGAVLPMHSHSNEQIVNVIEGKLELSVADEAHVLELPGDVSFEDGPRAGAEGAVVEKDDVGQEEEEITEWSHCRAGIPDQVLLCGGFDGVSFHFGEDGGSSVYEKLS